MNIEIDNPKLVLEKLVKRDDIKYHLSKNNFFPNGEMINYLHYLMEQKVNTLPEENPNKLLSSLGYSTKEEREEFLNYFMGKCLDYGELITPYDSFLTKQNRLLMSIDKNLRDDKFLLSSFFEMEGNTIPLFVHFKIEKTGEFENGTEYEFKMYEYETHNSHKMDGIPKNLKEIIHMVVEQNALTSMGLMFKQLAYLNHPKSKYLIN